MQYRHLILCILFLSLGVVQPLRKKKGLFDLDFSTIGFTTDVPVISSSSTTTKKASSSTTTTTTQKTSSTTVIDYNVEQKKIESAFENLDLFDIFARGTKKEILDFDISNFFKAFDFSTFTKKWGLSSTYEKYITSTTTYISRTISWTWSMKITLIIRFFARFGFTDETYITQKITSLLDQNKTIKEILVIIIKEKGLKIDDKAIDEAVKEIDEPEKDPNTELKELIIKIAKMLNIKITENNITVLIQQITKSTTTMTTVQIVQQIAAYFNINITIEEATAIASVVVNVQSKEQFDKDPNIPPENNTPGNTTTGNSTDTPGNCPDPYEHLPDAWLFGPCSCGPEIDRSLFKVLQLKIRVYDYMKLNEQKYGNLEKWDTKIAKDRELLDSLKQPNLFTNEMYYPFGNIGLYEEDMDEVFPPYMEEYRKKYPDLYEDKEWWYDFRNKKLLDKKGN